MKSKRPSSRKNQPSETVEAVSAMRLRVLLSSEQARKVSGWIYAAHAFRNAAVAFLTDRRLARTRWVARHPALAKGWIPEELRGSDTNACSQWLTAQLEQTRSELAQ